MSNLTQEAILAELAKLSDSKGRAMSFYDGQTIVPNSLLEQVWHEAERNTEQRIIKLLEEMPWDMLMKAGPNQTVILDSATYEKILNRDDAIALIKGEK
jgi:hypothetical protein